MAPARRRVAHSEHAWRVHPRAALIIGPRADFHCGWPCRTSRARPRAPKHAPSLLAASVRAWASAESACAYGADSLHCARDMTSSAEHNAASTLSFWSRNPHGAVMQQRALSTPVEESPSSGALAADAPMSTQARPGQRCATRSAPCCFGLRLTAKPALERICGMFDVQRCRFAPSRNTRARASHLQTAPAPSALADTHLGFCARGRAHMFRRCGARRAARAPVAVLRRSLVRAATSAALARGAANLRARRLDPCPPRTPVSWA